MLLAVAATLAIITPLAVMWWQSRVPSTYSVMDMGYQDHGGGPVMDHHTATTSVADLRTDPTLRADVVVDLVARQHTFALAGGRRVDGYTLNNQSPGPQIDAIAGQLIEVRLRNESVREGTTLHWHGVDVPNAEDGVAGVTQDAVPPGGTHTYRFVARQAGTFWYHSHQVSHDQVRRGLLGPLVIRPTAASGDLDVVAVSHLYAGIATINGRDVRDQRPARPGQRVRVRVINTDNGATHVWASAPMTVLAVDGYDLNKPTPVSGKRLQLAAGGRADLGFSMPADGSPVAVELGGAAQLVLGDGAVTAPPPEPTLDLLSYGTPSVLAFDPDNAQRHFRYAIGRRPGFVKGRPGMWWSINGRLFPDVPMFAVDKGDVVRMTLSNHSGELHPMHLHGHHAVVLSRNGVKSTGSPWWVDSLDVEDGESYEIAFVADNPGIWTDHCHNLPHAQQGLIAHVMYSGVKTPFRIGGRQHNEPE